MYSEWTGRKLHFPAGAGYGKGIGVGPENSK